MDPSGRQPAPAARASIDATTGVNNCRQSNWPALLEFAIVTLIFIADHRHLIPISKTPFLLLVGWNLATHPPSLVAELRTRAQAHLAGDASIGGGLLLEIFQLFETQPLLVRLTRKQPDLSDFNILHGNIKYTLLGIALAWTLAAFGEELVWRGYLMN